MYGRARIGSLICYDDGLDMELVAHVLSAYRGYASTKRPAYYKYSRLDSLLNQRVKQSRDFLNNQIPCGLVFIIETFMKPEPIFPTFIGFYLFGPESEVLFPVIVIHAFLKRYYNSWLVLFDVISADYPVVAVLVCGLILQVLYQLKDTVISISYVLIDEYLIILNILFAHGFPPE